MAQQFCDDSNLDSSLNYISGELKILGYPEISYDEKNERKVLVKLVNIAGALISKMEKLCIKENERTVEISKLNSQVMSHSHEKSRLEKLLSKEINLTLSVKASLATAISEQRSLSKELHQKKEEINKLKKYNEALNLQFGKEILRKENIILNLKDKLVRLVNNSACEVEEIPMLPQFSHIIKNYPKLDKCISSLGNNIQMLILENANIRYLLIQILVQISEKCDSLIDERELTHYLLNLPEKNFIDDIEKKIQCILGHIKS